MRRNPSAQYVQCAGRHILIDCGEGTQMQIRKFGIKFQRIDHIFISHLHGDHYFGLVGLLSTMHLLGRVKPIYIYGPKGLRQLVEVQLEAAKGKLAYEIEYYEIEPEAQEVLFEDTKIKVACFPLVHKIPTSGFIITEKEKERRLLVEKAERDGVLIEHYHKLKQGIDVEQDGKMIAHEAYTEASGPSKSYAYCSDTMFMNTTIEHVDGVNLLYHEATFVEKLRDRAESTKHSTAMDAARVAKEANAGRLLMGHLSARYDSGELHLKEAKHVFENCEVVEDGEIYFVE